MASDWQYAESNPKQHLAQLHYFSVIKQQGAGIEFKITVYEYVTPQDPAARYFAVSDKKTNQKSSPYTPVGWGNTLMVALMECLKAIEKFPYEGD